MKKIIVVCAALSLIAFAIPAMAGESVLPPNADMALIEENLFIGLASGNQGLERSCVLMLGKIQSDQAVIPLMTILHNNGDENLRVAAAWALCKIGDARGVYAVKMAVKFDQSSKVQAVCAWYYETYVKQGTFVFKQPELPLVATTP